MNVTLTVNYHTRWGEMLAVETAGRDGSATTRRMHPSGSDGDWTASFLTDLSAGSVAYRYLLIDADSGRILRREEGEPHTLRFEGDIPELVLRDRWHDRPSDIPFRSTAFTDCIFRRGEQEEPLVLRAGTTALKTIFPDILPDQELVVCGSNPALGQWDPEKAPSMNCAGFPLWQLPLPASMADTDRLEFKFVVRDLRTKRALRWEEGENRVLYGASQAYNRLTVIDCDRLALPATEWRGSGTAIPVFSIRTENDFGVGDFRSLMKMADWCAETGQRLLQILPVNDTTMTGTWTDCYPYNANSTFALHPIYLDVWAAGTLRDPARMDHFRRIAETLRTLPALDYEKVSRAKEAYMRELYAEQGLPVVESDDFKRFVVENSEWLRPYAAFCVLRDRFQTADMSMWGEYALYDEDLVGRFSENNRSETNYHLYIQYLLDLQLREAVRYAHGRGVALKGDIPIGISPTSVDAWVHPELFNLGMTAGAPPDAFAVMGQNWGFPTYNWPVMKRDGYRWWKARFRKMADYFDAYRIDHVLGFFRIWQIPTDTFHGLLGTFSPALPFTPDELRDRYGFTMDPEKWSRPYITRETLAATLGDLAGEAAAEYLIEEDDAGRIYPRSGLTTQRAIADLFATLPESDRNNRLCSGLIDLLDDVLFIGDPVEKGKYHPRINAQFTNAYHALPQPAKDAFNRAYNDFFYHRHNDFWARSAMEKLPELTGSARMLACAEDLGMIPDCVPDVLRRLEILSLEIERMPKRFGVDFDDTTRYPYYSVCSTSTHDMGGIRLWWEENRSMTQEYFNEILRLPGESPREAEPWICDRIVTRHLESPSMFCILPLQDWLSINGALRRDNPADEQINIPADPHHYWRYRMHLTVEKLLSDSEFTDYLRTKNAVRNV
ncbi:MAG: 4-alpha-glucanotransferase [Clostridium sp.]|nr:4-alpha-glucanotransferase [Clostridium sp.]